MTRTKKTAPSRTPPPPPAPGWAERVLNGFLSFLARFRRFGRDFLGVLILAFSLMTLLALVVPDLTSGFLLSVWRIVLMDFLGWGSFLMVIAGSIVGLVLLRHPAPENNSQLAGGVLTPPASIPWMRLFAFEAAAFTGLALLSAVGGNSLARAEAGLDGGKIGWGLAELLRLILSPIGLGGQTSLALITSVATLLLIMYGLGLGSLVGPRLMRWLEPPQALQPESDPAVTITTANGKEVPAAGAAVGAASKTRRSTPLPVEFRKKFRIQPAEEKSTPPPPRDERLPPLEILAIEQGYRPDERNINQTAGMIEKSLAEFGIPAKVVGFRVGPTVTQFAVEPGFLKKSGSTEEDANLQKVRVAQIAGLRRDLALALSAERLRIEAPVPGRPYVGIEVPNIRTSVVRLRPILETEAFYKIASPLAIALGRDVSGLPVAADLARMPHMLIAGTTGSGKSICIAALTTCLVMNNTPQDLRLVMIDPKMVELVRFNGLPHLYGKVETNGERIQGVLRWVVSEMERRYKLLEQMPARDLDAYNRKAMRRKGYAQLPRIVVMIDELADLMMSAPDQTEHTVVRLAQMARATGIHLVVATQRPSTDVVTGLIKANFPARISFAVAQAVDSRVILDTTGAESLLGQGDMLFLPPEASAPLRCQGVMVSDQEVEKVINFWQQTHPPSVETASPWEEMLAAEEVVADRDDLVLKAIAIVRDTQKASASMLQRRLHIGYPRAARVVDELEDMGVVGPAQSGGREREVLIGPEDEIPGRPSYATDEDDE
jgi:DNA segregation ATPase FtsK/SpoIIIE, S-DNA-T family